MASAPRILVVDDDVVIRRLVRTGLELEGFTVIEAATLAQARSVGTERVDGVVLDRQLPDGDGVEAYDDLQARYPGALIVLHSSSHVPDGYPSVPKGDVDRLVEAFGAPRLVPVQEGAPDVAREKADLIVADWIELCHWDPELPAESRPPIPGSIVGAVASALERPQPVGWGLDPALEAVAETYLLNHDALDVAVAQLVCLREAFERHVVEGLRPAEQLEAARRLTMIVQRLMTVVVRSGVAELEAQVFTDPATGLGNSTAFAVDLRRERDRAVRHGRPLTVARVSVAVAEIADGGDDALLRIGSVLGGLPGEEVHAYHLGSSQFAVVLPDALPVDADFVLGPLAELDIGEVSVGLATYPQDDLAELQERAERRLREEIGGGRLPWSKRVRQKGGPDL